MSIKTKRFHDYSQIDENDHELEDLEEQYAKEADEIEHQEYEDEY